MAVSADGAHWFLVNASPDLRAQIEAFPPLQPNSDSLRNSPIEAVLLTNADLDHVLGLFLLREGAPLSVHAPLEVREALSSSLGLSKVLKSFSGTSWHEPPLSFFPLLLRNGARSGLSYRALPLPGNPPRFANPRTLGVNGHSVAFEITDDRTSARLLLAPDVAALTNPLREALTRASAILFDGTFWQGSELQEVRSGARSASQMGHLPISEGSLEALRNAPALRKIYLHINNTNPILAKHSPERAKVEEAGIEVGVDGIEFEL